MSKLIKITHGLVNSGDKVQKQILSNTEEFILLSNFARRQDGLRDANKVIDELRKGSRVIYTNTNCGNGYFFVVGFVEDQGGEEVANGTTNGLQYLRTSWRVVIVKDTQSNSTDPQITWDQVLS